MKRDYDNDEAAKLFGNDIGIEINETSSEFSPYDDIFFHLYTPDNPNDPQFIQLGNASTLIDSNFNSTMPTRIVIHGWRPNVRFIPMFIEAYFEKGNHAVNLIIVNWLKGAETMLYNVARGRVKMVADRINKFIEFLVELGGMEYSDLTVIGHSLGAHMAGIGMRTLEHRTIDVVVILFVFVLFHFSWKKCERRENIENSRFGSSSSIFFV